MSSDITTTAPAGTAAPEARPKALPTLALGKRRIPVVLPSRGDPRLRLSAVIMTLQVLGQTLLGFKLSIAQILLTVAVCGVVEVAVTLRQRGMLVWPASGILTGNSVAFILRASGTRHGDWWSLRGIEFFMLAAAVSLLSKYLIRPGGRHLFNPSNVGIVWCLLVIGPARVFPQYLWWGPSVVGQVLAYAVILAGGVWVLRSVHMVRMVAAFLVTFAALIGALAVTGHHFFAIWHTGAIGGAAYWATIALSPELLVFVFFMATDPQTAPKSPRGRVIFGVATAVVAAALLSVQTAEFAVKLAILSSLTVTCALAPAIERLVRWTEGREARVAVPRRWVTALANPVVAAAAIVAVAAPADTARLSGNVQLVNIERGLSGVHNPQ